MACVRGSQPRQSSEGPLLAASRSASATNLGPHRVSFARISEPLKVPDLLALQTESFDWLLGNEKWKTRVQAAKEAGRRDVPEQSGLEEIFEEISPIEDFSGTMSLSFRDHRFEPSKFSFVKDTANAMIYTLSIHDAVPIWKLRPPW